LAANKPPGQQPGRRQRNPVCPVEALFHEDDVPGQCAQFTAENAKFLDQLGSPGGAAKTSPLPYDTNHIASDLTGRKPRRGQAYCAQGAAPGKR